MAFQGESRHGAAPRYHADAMTAMTNSEPTPFSETRSPVEGGLPQVSR